MRNLLASILICSSFVSVSALEKDTTSVSKHYTIDEVVVTGTKNETDKRYLPMSVSVVNREQISQRYEQSLLPILTEQVPGLFTTSRGIMGYGVSTGAAGGMSLRGIGGSPTTELLVLIDGHPQYMGLMGHPLADAYQSLLADKVEVVRGPASVLYGSNAMGGVINIVTRKTQEDGVKNSIQMGYGSFNTLITEASNVVKKGRFNSVASFSYNRSDGHRANMEFEQLSGFAKMGYDFSNQWKLYADVNITHFNASNPGSVTKPILDNDSHITRGMSSLSLENNYGNTSGAFMFYYNWGNHKINDGYYAGNTPPTYLFHSTDRLFGINWYQSASFFTGNRITVGVDYQNVGGKAWNQFTTSSTNIADKVEEEVAGYADVRQTLGSLITLDAGLRVDHFSVTGTELVPQAGVSLHLPQTAELKALVSKGFRNPTMRELYMFPPQNPNLLPEKMMNYEVSWSQRLLSNALSYGINLFYINGDNMIQTVFQNGRPININTGKVENRGIELNGSYRINASWMLSANYSWLHMKYPVVAAPEHKLFAGVDFTRGKWMVSTGVQYINGLYTSVSPVSQENFVLWNLRGSYQLSRQFSLFVRGENLLAQHYEINAGFTMPKATTMGGFNLKF
ncbi:TonB-dependent receptor plug domain-containing protein [Paludibacter jiangxiensis]|uniref:Iron complex outermembrane recepter protein n=1 Tax=Paludibacter jiangxiensis TaxID=681398 RepID=A0A171ADG5_9BACT|nr:TonB-dependent receptor [Paludibacter jiangxiensis]GAT63559.1 iron complex outermembrane recepter protein [Paludibacter jiangxiensis]